MSLPKGITGTDIDNYFARSKLTPFKVIGEDDRQPTTTFPTMIRKIIKENAANLADSEKVIIKDGENRIKIGALENALDPWIKICKVVAKGPGGGDFPATGWFAGPKTVVTAGHVLYDTQWGKNWGSEPDWTPFTDVFIGKSGTSALSKAMSTRFRVASAWHDFISNDPNEESRRYQVDLGCIQLDTSPWDVDRQFGIDATDSELKSRAATIAGYPADIDAGQIQVRASATITKAQGHTLFHEVDTNAGESGAPIWLGGADVKNPRVCGIHTGGNDASQINWGVRINHDVADLIKAWIAENP
jgi:glutamyl endopeptidase